MEEKMLEAQFVQLVMGLQSSAWMLLGKMANPMTGKAEPNLAAAKSAIDTLIMLKEKTKGNLSHMESQILSHAISQLEVNYVSEVENEEMKLTERAEGKSKDKR